MKTSLRIKSLFIGASLVTITMAAQTAHAVRGEDDGSYQRHLNQQQYNGCADYRLSVHGGEGGFRLMNNQKDFRSANNHNISGQVCSNGQVKIELSKRHPGTRVALSINGREYVFGQGDRGNKVINNWFRRYYVIDLPHQTSRNHNSNSNNQNYGNNSGYGNDNQGYQNHNYDNNDYGNNGYDNHGYSNNRPRPSVQQHNGHASGYSSHQQGYESKLYRTKSKKHRRAHKRGIEHSHHGRFFAFN